MKQSVIIKGSTSGMTVYLDPEIPFDHLLADITDRFQDAGKFFRNAKMAVTFEGRKLNREEEHQVVQTILAASPIQITCILDTDEEREAFFRRMVEEAGQPPKEEDCGQFYRGTLKDGQRLEIEGDIVLVGNVLAGARLVATGSILVIGSLQGTAYAGISGREGAYILAMDMLPTTLCIGDLSLKGTDPAFGGMRKKPAIAYRKEGRILLDLLENFDVSKL